LPALRVHCTWKCELLPIFLHTALEGLVLEHYITRRQRKGVPGPSERLLELEQIAPKYEELLLKLNDRFRIDFETATMFSAVYELDAIEAYSAALRPPSRFSAL
jgi:hypothetical protein